jgi:hypothetical protein
MTAPTASGRRGCRVVTHRETPPLHGARHNRTFRTSIKSGPLSVITIIDVVIFTLFDGVSGDTERECSDRAPCRSWC